MEIPLIIQNWRAAAAEFFKKRSADANLAPTAEDIKALTGAIAGAEKEIEGFRTQIAQAQATQNALQTQITQAQATQTALQTQITAEQNTVANLTAEITTLKAENEKLKASNAEKHAKILGSQGITPVLQGQDTGTKDLQTHSYVNVNAQHNREMASYLAKQKNRA